MKPRTIPFLLGIAVGLILPDSVLAQLPDLHPVDVHVNGIAIAGQTAEIVYTGINSGNSIEPDSAFFDVVSLSTTPAWDFDDPILAGYGGDGAMGAGESYTITNTVMFPAVPRGDYFFNARADLMDTISEDDETNNEAAFAVRVRTPDLLPFDAQVNGLAVAGQSVEIVFSVTNQGDGPILETGRSDDAWTDFVYLSSNTTWDAADDQLFFAYSYVPLPAGGSYTVTNTVSLPEVPRGNYYLIVRSDNNNNIFEEDETDNDGAYAVRILDPLLDQPVADAGDDFACFVGTTATFDGSASSNAQHYTWSLIARPEGSLSALSGTTTATPQLVPDMPGSYTAQLIVDFYGLTSTPDTVTLSASGIEWNITSQYGTPSPGTGLHSFAYGEVVSNFVDAAVQMGDTQYVCEGWSLAGHSPASGVSNSFVAVVTNHASLAWAWATNYWIGIEVNGSGTVSHPDGWHQISSTQEVSAIPSNGWLFTGWSGDISSGPATSNISLVVDRPWHLTASFSDDPDGDGLKNVDEWANNADPWKPDTDDDGFDDLWEAQHGWPPSIANNDVLPYILAHPEFFGTYTSNSIGGLYPGSLVIGVSNSAVHLSIQLETSPDLVPAAWTNAGPPVQWSMDVPTNKAFYRVGIDE